MPGEARFAGHLSKVRGTGFVIRHAATGVKKIVFTPEKEEQSKKLTAGISIIVVLIAAYMGIRSYASGVTKADEVIAKNANVADINYKKVS